MGSVSVAPRTLSLSLCVVSENRGPRSVCVCVCVCICACVRVCICVCAWRDEQRQRARRPRPHLPSHTYSPALPQLINDDDPDRTASDVMQDAITHLVRRKSKVAKPMKVSDHVQPRSTHTHTHTHHAYNPPTHTHARQGRQLPNVLPFSLHLQQPLPSSPHPHPQIYVVSTDTTVALVSRETGRVFGHISAPLLEELYFEEARKPLAFAFSHHSSRLGVDYISVFECKPKYAGLIEPSLEEAVRTEKPHRRSSLRRAGSLGKAARVVGAHAAHWLGTVPVEDNKGTSVVETALAAVRRKMKKSRDRALFVTLVCSQESVTYVEALTDDILHETHISNISFVTLCEVRSTLLGGDFCERWFCVCLSGRFALRSTLRLCVCLQASFRLPCFPCPARPQPTPHPPLTHSPPSPRRAAPRKFSRTLRPTTGSTTFCATSSPASRAWQRSCASCAARP